MSFKLYTYLRERDGGREEGGRKGQSRQLAPPCLAPTLTWEAWAGTVEVLVHVYVHDNGHALQIRSRPAMHNSTLINRTGAGLSLEITEMVFFKKGSTINLLVNPSKPRASHLRSPRWCFSKKVLPKLNLYLPKPRVCHLRSLSEMTTCSGAHASRCQPSEEGDRYLD